MAEHLLARAPMMPVPRETPTSSASCCGGLDPAPEVPSMRVSCRRSRAVCSPRMSTVTDPRQRRRNDRRVRVRARRRLPLPGGTTCQWSSLTSPTRSALSISRRLMPGLAVAAASRRRTVPRSTPRGATRHRRYCVTGCSRQHPTPDERQGAQAPVDRRRRDRERPRSSHRRAAGRRQPRRDLARVTRKWPIDSWRSRHA